MLSAYRAANAGYPSAASFPGLDRYNDKIREALTSAVDTGIGILDTVLGAAKSYFGPMALPEKAIESLNPFSVSPTDASEGNTH
jgi:hypothetical protein